jgi:hypothetical protein
VISCHTGPKPTARHVVLVTIDTLRADRLGCYGNPSVATPHLDRLAEEGALALDATVHAPLTRPSHTSMFTGLYPPEHGIRDNVSPSLAEDSVTLAEVLQGAGFRTGAFVSSIRRILDGRPSWDNFSGDTRPQTLARSKPDSLYRQRSSPHWHWTDSDSAASANQTPLPHDKHLKVSTAFSQASISVLFGADDVERV